MACLVDAQVDTRQGDSSSEDSWLTKERLAHELDKKRDESGNGSDFEDRLAPTHHVQTFWAAYGQPPVGGTLVVISTRASGETSTLVSSIRACHYGTTLAPPVRTPLGKRLWALRREIIASGEPLLNWDGVAREVVQRRGERHSEEGT